MVDCWPQYPAAYEACLGAFASAGCSDRATRNYVTLLALAHIVLSDEPVDAKAARRQVHQLAQDLKDEAAEALSSQESWLRYFRSRLLPFEGVTERLTVYELIRDAALSARGDLCQTEGTGGNAANLLKQIGVVIRRPKDRGRVEAMAIANDHAGVTRLHHDTPWAGGPGRKGGWVDAARELPDAEQCKARFVGPPERGTSIPREVVLGIGWETGATKSVGNQEEPVSEPETAENQIEADDKR